MSNSLPKYRFDSPGLALIVLLWTGLSVFGSLFVVTTYFQGSALAWACAGALVLNGSVGLSGLVAYFKNDGPVGPGIFAALGAGAYGSKSGGELDDEDGGRSSHGPSMPEMPTRFNLATGYEMVGAFDTAGFSEGHSDTSDFSSGISSTGSSFD